MKRYITSTIHFIFRFIIFGCLLFSGNLISQSLEKESSKTIIQWKLVRNAVSYQLEIIPDDKKERKMKIETKEGKVNLDLKPGEYKYRVGAVNKFKKVKHWSDWLPLEVVLSIPPIIEEDSSYLLYLPEKEKEIVVRGKHFLEAIKVELEYGLDTLPIENFRRISKTELRFTINFESFTKPEKFRLILINPLDKITKKNNFIILDRKPPPKLPSVVDIKNMDDPNLFPEEVTQQDSTANGKNGRGYTGSVLPPLWRSALIPGWGQSYKGESKKGYIIGGSVLFFVASSYIFDRTKAHSLERSQNLGNALFILPADKNLLASAIYLRNQSLVSRRKAEDELQKQNAVLGIAAAIYIYNLVDVVWNRKPVETAFSNIEQTSGFYLNTGQQGKGSFQFGYFYRF